MRFLVHFFTLIGLLVTWVFAGNTTCLSNALDWYTNSVGETPCKTYERLRQLCDRDYQVGNLAISPPGDTCTDQLKYCCCNSVAFALSMLCLSCQWDQGGPGDIGYDAGAGAYQNYIGKCDSPVIHNTTTKVQAAICNSELKIPKALYQLFWYPGDWYYVYTKQSMTLDMQSGLNDSGLCPSPSSNPAVASITGDAKTWRFIGIAGIALGGLNILACLILAYKYYRQQRRSQIKDLVDLNDHSQTTTNIDLSPSHQYHQGYTYTPVSSSSSGPYHSLQPLPQDAPETQPSKRQLIADNFRAENIREALQASRPRTSITQTTTETESIVTRSHDVFSSVLPPSYSGR